MSIVEVFADVACPFTHVGLRRIVAARRARGATGVRLRCRAWPLEWVNGEPLAPGFVAHEVRALREQVAPELFARFDPARFPVSSIPALALAAVAYGVGIERGEMVSLLLRDELFEQGHDLADPTVLDRVAERAGIARPDPRTAEGLVRAEYDSGRARGVIGSPHFFAGAGAGTFCPSLRITKVGDAFHIEEDIEASARLLDAVL